MTPLITMGFNTPEDLLRPIPEGYEGFSRYCGEGEPSTTMWYILPEVKRFLLTSDSTVLDTYTNFCRSAPMFRRLLTVRSEWSKK